MPRSWMARLKVCSGSQYAAKLLRRNMEPFDTPMHIAMANRGRYDWKTSKQDNLYPFLIEKKPVAHDFSFIPADK